MAQVLLNNVEKIYPGKISAVRDFNLTIQDGEFIVLVGPSGCGKSTTLRMIAGLEEVTSGTITIDDQIVNDVHPKDRDIAMVFQNYALYPHMTVYKNMAFALKLRKMPKDEIDNKVRSTAAVLGIETLLKRKPKALSGGQRQRVALGRAIVRDPKAFLFDEPLSNLDAKLRVEMRAELKRLHLKLKTTTIYVTHDQEEAMTLGDRVVVMNHALLQQVGAPLEIYRKPCNRFVAGFLGTPPMNFIDGVIDKNGSGYSFVESGTDGLRFGLPADRDESLAPYRAQPVTLGIRPEFLRASASNNENGTRLAFDVQVVEPLGDRMDVYLKTPAGTPLVARISSTNEIQQNAPAEFDLDVSAIHLFEPGPDGIRIGAK